ncbi:MAG: VWA domain-containing protein, partial [Sedimentisphaerales bacterium]
MFLHTTVPRFKNRSRIENVLLLILRCLVLCLLAFGFARPFFPRQVEQAAVGSGSRIAFLIDTSASMRRPGLWNQAVSQAQSVLREGRPADRLCVMNFDQSTQTLVSFEQWGTLDPARRVSVASEQISKLSPGWARTDLGQALVTAAEAIQDDEVNDRQQSAATHRIVLVSDMQEGAALEALHAYEWPERMELTVKQIQGVDKTNATLQQVARREGTSASSPDEKLRIRVTNSPDATVERFNLNWAADKTASGPIAEVYAPAGHSVIVRVPAPEDESAGGALVLSGDDDAFDNVLYLAPHLRQEAKIFYVGGDDVNDPKGMLYYVQRAFGATDTLNPQITLPSADGLTDENVAKVHLVIVADVMDQRNMSSLRRYLESGGTVLLAMRSARADATVATLVGIDHLECEEAEDGTYAMLSQIDFEHPLLAPFSEPRFGDFTQIHFWKHRRVNVADLPDAKVLARFDDNDPAWFELSVGKGALIVMTSGWQPADSQLALSTKFVPLLYSILEFSGVLVGQQSQYLVGDPVTVPQSVASASGPVQIRKPNGTLSSLKADGKVFTQTDMPGLYVFSVEGVPPSNRGLEARDTNRLFAVNLPAKESQIAAMPIENLEQYGVSFNRSANLVASGPESSANPRYGRAKQHSDLVGLEYKQKVWRWVFIALLAVSLIEIGLAGWLTRAPSPVEGEKT